MFSGVFDLPWWGYVVVALALTHVTIASVTIFLHRHQAHRSLDLHPLPSHFFRLWLWLTTGMITREWAAIHRKHHAKCETVDDPHSPQIHGVWKVLFGGVLLYRKESLNQETMSRYGHGTPDDWLERHIYTPYNFAGIVLTLGVNLVLFGLLPGVLIWAVQMLWIPFWAAGVINGIGHFWGYRRFNCADTSTNICPWGILIGGEELHNNHHAFATSAKLSNQWWEFDIGWLYIRLLSFFGLAQVKKIAPRPKLVAVRATVDAATLQALITHRYDLLARYAKSLRQAFEEELRELKTRLPSTELKQVNELKRWLSVDARQMPGEIQQRFEALLTQKGHFATLYAMRQELAALWERSSSTGEQLVAQLQDWCRRAESSGIRSLEELSLRVRRYAV